MVKALIEAEIEKIAGLYNFAVLKIRVVPRDGDIYLYICSFAPILFKKVWGKNGAFFVVFSPATIKSKSNLFQEGKTHERNY